MVDGVGCVQVNAVWTALFVRYKLFLLMLSIIVKNYPAGWCCSLHNGQYVSRMFRHVIVMHTQQI